MCFNYRSLGTLMWFFLCTIYQLFLRTKWIRGYSQWISCGGYWKYTVSLLASSDFGLLFYLLKKMYNYFHKSGFTKVMCLLFERGYLVVGAKSIIEGSFHRLYALSFFLVDIHRGSPLYLNLLFLLLFLGNWFCCLHMMIFVFSIF